MAQETMLSSVDWLMPRTFINQILCFPRGDHKVFELLKSSLRRLTVDVPYLLSGVVGQEHPRGSVRLTEPYQTLDELMTLYDSSHVLDYATLRANNFPPTALTNASIQPPDTTAPFLNPVPVFRAKLSLVKGGAILYVAIHHSTTDITGLGALLKLWSSHCWPSPATDLGFNRSWCDRGPLLEISASWAGKTFDSNPELVHIIERSARSKATGTPPRDVAYETAIFYFPRQTLQRLKVAVTEHLACLDNGVRWVSKGDIIAALLWSATVWAEQTGDPETAPDAAITCTAGIPVNFRPRLNEPLPKHYLGAAFAMTKACVAQRDLCFLSEKKPAEDVPLDSEFISTLARVSSAIRASLIVVDQPRIEDALGFVSSKSDITSVKLGPRHGGISLVSWADEGVYELDWGETIGMCDAVRLPKMRGKRYPIILPRLPKKNGHGEGLEVIVSFDRKTMARFRESQVIRLFGTLTC
ncbi:hypothetical protein BKA67DRAFT_548195 [Truncatella angustata]|uniref:Trichothecene 3-O-acetyltransferase-like N-terminal domain-containing protein n=1 Tax=Truncatella angustata TaxID=152316 RepID=A0A9P8UYF7_9PEZI|nr:uncharacterized protein BKA67DRAFT_548195 [Truncatella angustata]KAH6660488.1 hypothetical protein BKA67DRAFT_548195 [Truncatella angustata]